MRHPDMGALRSSEELPLPGESSRCRPFDSPIAFWTAMQGLVAPRSPVADRHILGSPPAEIKGASATLT